MNYSFVLEEGKPLLDRLESRKEHDIIKKLLNKKAYPLQEMSGIYTIHNTQTEKIYIGQSVRIYWRFREHFSDLVKRQHKNQMLQNDFSKMGKKCFSVSCFGRMLTKRT